LTEITGIIATGILIGVVLLALKSGIGCAFASISRREIMYLGSLYLVISILMGYLIEMIPVEFTNNILATGLGMHIIVAIGLLYFGIKTKKSWLSRRCDISRNSFLWISLPCPVCLTATFLSCTVLCNLLEISNIKIGFIVGLVLSFGVVVSTFSVRYLAEHLQMQNPSSLGSAMILLGLFYLLSPIVIPAYIQMQSIPVFEASFNLNEALKSFLLIALLVASGFFSNRMNIVRRRE